MIPMRAERVSVKTTLYTRLYTDPPERVSVSRGGGGLINRERVPEVSSLPLP